MRAKLIRLGDTAIIKKFWQLIDKAGPFPKWREFMGNCWLWQGPLNDSGYPYFCIGHKTFSATHVTWELSHPWQRFPKGMDAAHLCCVPTCVRPDHICPMSHEDNQLMETLEHATLSPLQVAEIRALAEVKTTAELAAMYSVADTTITRAVKGETWGSING